MQWGWSAVWGVLVITGIIFLFERKRLKKASKADRITFVAILILSAMISLFNLENLPGPLSLLQYIFGPLGKFME